MKRMYIDIEKAQNLWFDRKLVNLEKKRLHRQTADEKQPNFELPAQQFLDPRQAIAQFGK